MSESIDSSSDLYVTDVKGNVLKKEKDCHELMESTLVRARELIEVKNIKE